MPRFVAVLLLAALVSVQADVFFHNPRGSNNRLNGNLTNRKSNNRMFDSQNNNKGGYNAGDAKSTPAAKEEGQYRMKYFASGSSGKSHMTVEWTNQHGCGGNANVNCNVVLQYMCQPDSVTATGNADTFRNGFEPAKQAYGKHTDLNEKKSRADRRKFNSVKPERGVHEKWDWYDKCFARERNAGLFTADQQLKADNGLGYSSSIYTRQNKNGGRSGYECPEERDYYPYWHPSPWKDIAVLVDDKNLCGYYQSESYNVQQKYECVEQYPDGSGRKHWSRWNNEQDCTSNGGQWLAFTNYLEKAIQFTSQAECQANSSNGIQYVWGRPEGEEDEQCLVALDAPDCLVSPTTRVNHLGNTPDGEASRYEWTLPYFPSGETQRCVMRIRYNITTGDYNPQTTDSNSNGDASPVKNDPDVDIVAGVQLSLAVNTAQYGRTFQDRSHAMLMMPRPAGLESSTIYNLNVRGKRGNLQQTIPAVEYDFIPNNLEINDGDLVHVQWTGSNTHNNNNAGNAGEGRAGSDRSNVVQLEDRLKNYPLSFEETTMWTNAHVKWIYFQDTPSITAKDLVINLATSGYYQCEKTATCGDESIETKVAANKALNKDMNNAPASYGGALIQFPSGEYFYMCTRNNNFTNRSQKGRLLVKQQQ
ncbi:protein DD3-3-like [Asterias amurensis]|uniref:protein DD3-3-like n=1 Tax=Asterias amurensis TaxID=7602 RepID=UPI003AB617AA